MRHSAFVASFALLAGCVSPGLSGMGATDRRMADTVQQRQMQSDGLMASMDAARAAANRPGDEAMTCDQIQAEMTAMFQDPKFTATMASLQAQGERTQAKVEAAQSGAVTSAVAGSALGLAGSFVPGMSWLTGAFMQAQMASADKQMNAVNRDADAMMSELSGVMPQMMRGQRLNEAGAARKCAFLSQNPT